jgi:CRP-like cAMP-binding protein
MAQLRQASVRNRLLSALNRDDFDLLQPDLEPVALELRQWVIEAGQPVQQIYFPEHGIVSILADTSEGRIEVGLIGPEGMAGLPVVLGVDRSPHGYMVQAAGEALRITTLELRMALQQSPSLQAGLLRYAHALMVQTAQTAYANAGFSIEARLARWILMTDDRLEGGDLPLTHDFLSMMLGVRRPGVTLAVQGLEGNRLIRAARGRITVLDRTGLEEVADTAYGVSEAEYASVMEQAHGGASPLYEPALM